MKRGDVVLGYVRNVNDYDTYGRLDVEGYRDRLRAELGVGSRGPMGGRLAWGAHHVLPKEAKLGPGNN